MNINDRYRRWQRYRTMKRELRDYPSHALTELGIAKADIVRVAYDAVYGPEH